MCTLNSARCSAPNNTKQQQPKSPKYVRKCYACEFIHMDKALYTKQLRRESQRTLQNHFLWSRLENYNYCMLLLSFHCMMEILFLPSSTVYIERVRRTSVLRELLVYLQHDYYTVPFKYLHYIRQEYLKMDKINKKNSSDDRPKIAMYI